METSNPPTADSIQNATVLVVGVGGLGCPAAVALVASGVGRLLLADDDQVEVSNLHRQILFGDEDVGSDKLSAACTALRRWYPDSKTAIEAVPTRLLPDNAQALVSQADVVVEGADNFATKFLAADACALQNRPVVHGSAIRWRFTVMAVSGSGSPCYRCLFEDVPQGPGAQQNCATAGVMPPVVGIAGALMADLALRIAAANPSRAGGASPFGVMHSYDGLRDRWRSVGISRRPSCSLCGQDPSIHDTHEARYLSRPPISCGVSDSNPSI